MAMIMTLKRGYDDDDDDDWFYESKI